MVQMCRLICMVLTGAMMLPLPASGGQRRAAGAAPACGDVIGFQVLLARRGFSTGVIDGQAGANFDRALAAFQEAHNLPRTQKADCATWTALESEGAGPTVVSYRITAADAAGPFTDPIPEALAAQAALPSLGYTSLLESLAERFRTSPDALRRLNHGRRFSVGEDIQVPGVEPFVPQAARPRTDPSAADFQVLVARAESALRVVRADGSLVFFAPVTTGSERDPLPTGTWKVTGVSWLPPFHYNPDLFWDAKSGDPKATLKPGPNSPVGVVWIDVNVEHYGIHGTPEPTRVGHAESHGCVRLTNWDAATLASLVRPGTPVQFR